MDQNISRFSTITFLVIFTLSLTSSHFYSQTKEVDFPEIQDNADLIFDSLITDLENASIDTIRVNMLNEIAWHYAPTNFEKSVTYVDSALALARKIKWKRGEAFALKHKGEALRYGGDIKKSLLTHEASLSLFEQLEDKLNIASLLTNIGISYHRISEYLVSYTYYDKALNIFLDLDNRAGIQKLNIYLGILYYNLNDYEKSIDRYEFALKYADEMEDNSTEASILGNIGIIYHELSEFDKALDYYQQALELFKDLNDTYNYSLFLGNIGNLYADQKFFVPAMNYIEKAFAFYKKIGNEQGIAIQCGNLGRIKFKMATDSSLKQSELKVNSLLISAEKDLKKSIEQLREIGNKEKELFYLITLADLFKNKHSYYDALLTREKVQEIADSISSSDINKRISKLSVSQDFKLHEKEIEVLNKEKEYQNLVKQILIGLAIVLVLFSIVIYFQYSSKKRHNEILEANITERKKAERALLKNELELNKHKNNLEIVVKKRTEELQNEIQERKRTEEDLLVAIDRVETANKAKSVFLENMSHELRTPLVGILGYSNLLSKEVPTKDLKEMSDGINRTGNRLLNTLSMVLDLARIESDKFEIHKTKVNLVDEINSIYHNFKGAVALKNIDFLMNVSDDSKTIFTDAGMFKVIVENLVNNAIKFTQKGKITIEAKSEFVDSKEYINISIVDTGIGIKKDEVQLIFKEFKQLSEGTLKDFQGTGLGLSISEKFTKHLNGELKVESEFGVGSTFTLKLPVK